MPPTDFTAPVHLIALAERRNVRCGAAVGPGGKEPAGGESREKGVSAVLAHSAWCPVASWCPGGTSRVSRFVQGVAWLNILQVTSEARCVQVRLQVTT